MSQFQLTEIEQLRLENLQIKKANLNIQFTNLDLQEKVFIKAICDKISLKEIDISHIDYEKGILYFKE